MELNNHSITFKTANDRVNAELKIRGDGYSRFIYGVKGNSIMFYSDLDAKMMFELLGGKDGKR